MTLRYGAHLVRRFVGSLRPGGPDVAEERWALDNLIAGEAELWATMSGPDRRHAVGVARRTAAALGAEATRPVLAAALLHDVGKVCAGLGLLGRVVATVVGGLAPRRARRWRGRIGRYVAHPELGAELLAGVGSDELTVAWAREHHRPPTRWTVPRRVADALKAADDD